MYRKCYLISLFILLAATLFEVQVFAAKEPPGSTNSTSVQICYGLGPDIGWPNIVHPGEQLDVTRILENEETPRYITRSQLKKLPVPPAG